jgi:hypothetical protein
VRPLFTLLLLSGIASARTTSEVAYSLKDVYTTAMRFVRIDRSCKLLERDPEAAYLTFECEDDGKQKRGALEMFKSGEQVRLQLSLTDDPRYVEMRFLELFERKLRDELGAPVSKKPPPPPPDLSPPGG